MHSLKVESMDGGGNSMDPVQGTPVFKAEKFNDLRDLVVQTCAKYSELDAFIFRRSPKLSEVHRSFFEYGNDIKGLATYILNSEYAGERLAVVGENAYEWFVSYNAILSSGAVGVPLDRALPEDELIQLLVRSKSRLIFYHHRHHKMMLSIRTVSRARQRTIHGLRMTSVSLISMTLLSRVMTLLRPAIPSSWILRSIPKRLRSFSLLQELLQ